MGIARSSAGSKSVSTSVERRGGADPEGGSQRAKIAAALNVSPPDASNLFGSFARVNRKI
jgi:hypothetical protein